MATALPTVPPDIVATAVPDGDPGETVENTVKAAVIPASK